MEITSITNIQVKSAVKLQLKKYRDLEKLFLLEGFKSIQEAYQSGIEIEKIFVLAEKSKDYSFLEDKLILTNEAVLSKISTTDTPPDAVAIAHQPSFDKEKLKHAKKVVLLENIKDLGNLGTILRTAVAFNVDAVVLYGDCADLYNPKCVRSSVGNLWKIPVYHLNSLAELEIFKDFQRVATLPRANSLLKDFEPKDRCLVMFGSEADGLSDELIKFSTDSVKIEMNTKVESLNLSVSCAVIMYELFNSHHIG